MDRLVCGDVGFGKTEVAVRAAFAVARERPADARPLPDDDPRRAALEHVPRALPRLPGARRDGLALPDRPPRTKRILADFQAGKVDVLVGTHRILSRDVIPKDLGLVILDEEQRFGVAQKELLRSLRLEVDVLALSATPIPRTLHMSLSGLRDISIIETPPEGRRPIRTTVGEYDEEQVKHGARARGRARRPGVLPPQPRRDDRRGGRQAGAALPGLRFLVAHGKMRERELEEKMHAFLAGDADVLVSTTIIESGIDIPQANTLVVERADALGLSQLYQIRGRVGRSDVTAHAYLFYPDASELSPEARARLATLADHTELGAGFQIAMRDLEIRGAGDLLGDEQSGHVAALGFELYVEMLARGGRRALRPAARRRAARARRRAGRRLRPGGLHRLRGAQDRPAPPPRARRGRGRAARAAGGDRGPLRAGARAGREPLRDPGGEAEARAGGADYFVFRGGRATVGRSCSARRAARAPRPLDTAVYVCKA